MSQFTPGQTAALKAFIQADPTLGPKASAGDYEGVANGLNAIASPAFPVWRRNVPATEVLNAVVWANLTPAQAIPTSPQLDVLVWQAKALACQGKQFNLQTMTQGRTSLPTQNVSFRTGLQDCLTAVPSKADGTTQAAGWNAVQNVIQRSATVAEKVLITGTTGVASDLGWEGLVDVFEIGEILS